MALTSAVSVLANDVTLTAGAADTTSSAIDMRTEYGATAVIKLTNGATGPTVPAQVQIQVSPDNSNWYNFGGDCVGSTTNNGIYQFMVDIPPGFYVRSVAGSNTGQNVTARVELVRVTGI
jgi:hypothetical protein